MMTRRVDKLFVMLGATISGVALAASAQAATIISYDVTNASLSGFGGWAHTYNGTIAGSTYSGGSGTLNDGAIGTSEVNTQLFETNLTPTITAFLDSATTIGTIDVLTGLFPNSIPGNIVGFTVTIGVNSAAYTTTGFGSIQGNGYFQNQRITLTGQLASTATTSFTLSNFITAPGSFDFVFAIGELAVTGQQVTPAVPEPATWAMMMTGFGLVGGAMRYRRRKTSVSFG